MASNNSHKELIISKQQAINNGFLSPPVGSNGNPYSQTESPLYLFAINVNIFLADKCKFTLKHIKNDNDKKYKVKGVKDNLTITLTTSFNKPNFVINLDKLEGTNEDFNRLYNDLNRRLNSLTNINSEGGRRHKTHRKNKSRRSKSRRSSK